MVAGQTAPIESLYVHVPFCAQKCAYCAFYSEATSGEAVNRYVSALTREMEMVAADLWPETVFFGGGTPSLLNLRQWERVLKTMQRLNLLGAQEWTVECNPATVSLDKARLLRSYGVNRISMGVQSLNPALLERLGRIHSRDMVFKSFDILRQAGFENLNLDLMFAIPGQTLPVWRETLSEAIALGSEHLSCYEVIYEEDTALYAQLKAGEFDVDEDLACDMYDELVERGGAAGLRRYEVANFARGEGPKPKAEDRKPKEARRPKSEFNHHPYQKSEIPSKQFAELAESEDATSGFGLRASFGLRPSDFGLPTSAFELPARACMHNVNYWRGGSFYGLGPSATSYVRAIRSKNWSNTQLYCDQLEKEKRAIESSENLGPLARAGETAAFGLRMVAGWPFEQFRQVTGYDLRESWAPEMDRLSQQGLGQLTAEGFRLTSQGLRFADAAAALFLR